MESLYRTYRPQTFADVVGQAHVVTTLERAVTDGRIAHAYLFCGPRGTGKTTMARLLAKALLCDAGPRALPDGSCEQCRLIAAGENPDVYELDAASRTGVDNVREEIIASVAFAPVMGRAKVYIIDEVHMLTTAAFNALLKTLEEPPEHVTFVLCTTESSRVPETILSRVQRFDFHAIGMEELVGRLVEVCSREGIVAEPAALELVARHARGGMRDALASLEQLAVFGGGRVELASAEALLGAAGSDELGALVRALAARDIGTLFSQVGAAVDGGRDLLVLTRELAARLRDVYVAAALAGDEVLSAAESAAEAADTEGTSSQAQAIIDRVPVAALATTGEVAVIAAEALAFASADRVARALAHLADASAEMRTAPNQRLVLEIALTRIARPESDLTLEALSERISALEASVASMTDSVARGARLARPVAEASASSQEGAGVSDGRQADATDIPDGQNGSGASATGRGVGAPSLDPAAAAWGSATVAAGQAWSPQQGGGAAVPGESGPRAEGRATPQAGGRAEPSSAASAAERDHAIRSAASSQALGASPMSSHADHPAPTVGAAAGAVPGDGAPQPADADLQRRWRRVVEELIAANPARGSLLASATLESDDGQTLMVTLPKGSTFAAKMLARPDIQATIAPVVERFFGQRRVVYAEASLVAADIARVARAASGAGAPRQTAVPTPAPAAVSSWPEASATAPARADVARVACTQPQPSASTPATPSDDGGPDWSAPIDDEAIPAEAWDAGDLGPSSWQDPAGEGQATPAQPAPGFAAPISAVGTGPREEGPQLSGRGDEHRAPAVDDDRGMGSIRESSGSGGVIGDAPVHPPIMSPDAGGSSHAPRAEAAAGSSSLPWEDPAPMSAHPQTAGEPDVGDASPPVQTEEQAAVLSLLTGVFGEGVTLSPASDS